MPRFLDRRRTLGSALIAAGAGTIGGTLALTGPATSVAHAAQAPGVFLVIHLTDSAGGQLPGGGTVVFTAAVTNSSSASAFITAATPTVTLSFPSDLMGFSTNNSGWTCSVGSAGEVCTDGTVATGSSTSLLATFTVSSGRPVGNAASVTGTVSDASHLNSATFSQGLASATDNATIAAPSSYSKDVTPVAYPSKIGNDQTVSNNSVNEAFTFTDTAAANTIIVAVPSFAINQGAHITVYGASGSYWTGALSSKSSAIVDGYAVAWTNSGESTPSNAASSVTLTVSNSSIKSTDTLYRASGTGIATSTGVVGNGAWTVSFTVDPGFVLAQAAAAPPASTSTAPSTSAAGTTTITAPTSGGGDTRRGGGTTLPLSIGVLLVLCGTVVIGSGRRRHEG